MNKQKHPISKWLDMPNYDGNNPPKYILNHRNLETYYLENDKNLKSNVEYKIKELKRLNKEINNANSYDDLISSKTYEELDYDKDLINDSNFIHVFRKENGSKFFQYIDQDTRRYHVNMLFNQMVDYCYFNKMVGYKGELFINKKMRNAFVKFCHENSK